MRTVIIIIGFKSKAHTTIFKHNKTQFIKELVLPVWILFISITNNVVNNICACFFFQVNNDDT